MRELTPSTMTKKTSKKSPHRSRFSRNTVEADIRERIRELEKRRKTNEPLRLAAYIFLDIAPEATVLLARINELKYLLDRWGLEKP